jgi:hypothetical protein
LQPCGCHRCAMSHWSQPLGIRRPQLLSSCLLLLALLTMKVARLHYAAQLLATQLDARITLQHSYPQHTEIHIHTPAMIAAATGALGPTGRSHLAYAGHSLRPSKRCWLSAADCTRGAMSRRVARASSSATAACRQNVWHSKEQKL